MENNSWNNKTSINIRTAAKNIGIKTDIINNLVRTGRFESKDGRIQLSDYEMIKNQHDSYIEMKDFLSRFDSDSFQSKLVQHRNKFIDFLEDNKRFGIVFHYSNEFLFCNEDKSKIYISCDDIPLLTEKAESFFEEYGLTEQEKIEKLLLSPPIDKQTLKHLRKYLALHEYTPSLTSFVRMVVSAQPISKIQNEEILALIEQANSDVTKEYLVDFYMSVWKKEKGNIQYDTITLNKKESSPTGAYEAPFVAELALILFNSEYADINHLIEKALDNSFLCEAWTFIACHFVGGWRAGDICNSWAYLGNEGLNVFKINPDTIRDDLLNKRISKEALASMSDYVSKKIELQNRVPSKTNFGKLLVAIEEPTLKEFFGIMLLIAEYHRINYKKKNSTKSKEEPPNGYMHSTRTDKYLNRIKLAKFFGKDIKDLLGEENLSGIALNKVFLQGLEYQGRLHNQSPIMAHLVASFARNHANVNTILSYIKDHGFDGQSAEFVLHAISQRGVLGVITDSFFQVAYPEVFERLTETQRTEVIKQWAISPYEIETLVPAVTMSLKLQELLVHQKDEEICNVFQAMFNIAQGDANAKDKGVYCTRRAFCLNCVHTNYYSCIVNLCPYHIFTHYGIDSLIELIKKYDVASRDDKKAEMIRDHLIVSFKSVLSTILNNFNSEEQNTFKRLLEEKING